MSTEDPHAEFVTGARVQVLTHDGHVFRAEFVELRRRDGREDLAVLRFDTGWVTSYPVSMVRSLPAPQDRNQPAS